MVHITARLNAEIILVVDSVALDILSSLSLPTSWDFEEDEAFILSCLFTLISDFREIIGPII